MRDLKFKVFHNGMLKPVHQIDFSASVLTTETNDGKDEVTLYFGGGENTPMQYTGLKDKNGVEIYEGDIVLRFSNGWKKEKVGVKRFQVVYEDKGGRIGFNVSRDKILEVIGNIYENPELLSKN